MKTKLLIVATLIALLGLTISAFAGFGGERLITASGGLRLTGGSGPSKISIVPDGSGTVKLLKGSSAATTTTLFSSSGDSIFYLRDGFIRTPPVIGSTVDSLYFILDTATEVIVSW